MNKILIIEDDRALCDSICEYFERYGFDCNKICDFKNIENEVESVQPNLVLLDINLPYTNGFFVCRALRKKYKFPIIIISARNGEMEQVMGMEQGADDYLLKPFSLEVLMAKVRAAIRRCYGEFSSLSTQDICIGNLKLDSSTFCISNGVKTLELSKNEYRVLRLLFERKDEIVKREDILEVLWNDQVFIDENTLSVNISRVRARLRELGVSDAIKTRKGLGYIFESGSLMEGVYA